MKNMIGLDGCFIMADMDDLALVWMEFHLPYCLIEAFAYVVDVE